MHLILLLVLLVCAAAYALPIVLDLQAILVGEVSIQSLKCDSTRMLTSRLSRSSEAPRTYWRLCSLRLRASAQATSLMAPGSV